MKKLKFKLDALHSAEVLTREQLKNVLRSSVGGTGGANGMKTCFCSSGFYTTCGCNDSVGACCGTAGQTMQCGPCR